MMSAQCAPPTQQFNELSNNYYLYKSNGHAMKKNQACFFAWIVHVPSVEIELKWKNLDAQMSIKINHEHVQIIESMANKQSLKGRWQKTSPKVA